MSSAYFSRDNAVLPFTPAADYSDKVGQSVTLSGVTATLSASATTVARGIILDGGVDADSQISVGIISALGAPVRVKLGGTVAAGAMLVQHTDGTYITDPGSGARVQSFLALEAGVAGELIEAAPQTPLTLS
jgi:hypothetical protein